MKKSSLVLSLILSLLLPSPALSETLSWFSDVDDHLSTREGIWQLYQEGDVSGYADGTFHPLQEVNRAEAMKIILNGTDVALLSEPLSGENSESPAFPDVPEDAWYKDYLNTAWNLDIVSGNDDGSFSPERSINRAEALKMILLASGIETDPSAPWYQPYLDYGIENALIVPDSAFNYHPEALVSRGELCDMIYRLQREKFTGELEFGKATYYADIFVGDHTANGEVYSHEALTAAHRTLPFGTKIRVTNLASNLSVEVTVNDRGPYVDGYIVDLSQSAFDAIGNLSTGVFSVRIEVLNP